MLRSFVRDLPTQCLQRFVVTDANQGDHVYVRMGQTSNGKVLSIDQSTTTFSGWLLS